MWSSSGTEQQPSREDRTPAWQAVEPIAKRLAASRPEAEWGFSGALEHAEYNDPTPRWREAFIRGAKPPTEPQVFEPNPGLEPFETL